MTEFDEFDGPVCRFGPGGEYVKDWPAKKNQLPVPGSNQLNKVLALIADVMGTTVSGELMIQSQGPACVGAHGKAAPLQANTESPADNYMQRGKQSGATDKPDHTNYTPSTAGAKDSSRIAAEPMLFSDDSGSGRGAGRKPHYRIRAYRRSSRKRPAHKIEAQATLFEVDGASQSAA